MSPVTFFNKFGVRIWMSGLQNQTLGFRDVAETYFITYIWSLWISVSFPNILWWLCDQCRWLLVPWRQVWNLIISDGSPGGAWSWVTMSSWGYGGSPLGNIAATQQFWSSSWPCKIQHEKSRLQYYLIQKKEPGYKIEGIPRSFAVPLPKSRRIYKYKHKYINIYIYIYIYTPGLDR